MIGEEEYRALIYFTYIAHQLKPNKHGSITRQRHQVPYVVHPVWCAHMVLNDTSLTQEQRENGFRALLLHDVLEDTCEQLPPGLSKEVVELVNDMTYKNFEEEKKIVPQKTKFLQLLKIVDKVATIYDNYGDNSIFSTERKKDWCKYTESLLANVESEFGNSQIYKVAKTIVDNCGW